MDAQTHWQKFVASRTDKLISASIRWAVAIMKRIDAGMQGLTG
jgi:hypothetical protein